MTRRLPRLRKKEESRLMKSEVIPAYSSPSVKSFKLCKEEAVFDTAVPQMVINADLFSRIKVTLCLEK